MVTYDIACQYKKNVMSHQKDLPKDLRPKSTAQLHFATPVWHGNVHELSCKTENSLLYQYGAGKSDREGPERVWVVLNPLSWATKEMGPGARHNDIEDKIDHHNFYKNVHEGLSCYFFLHLTILTFSRTDTGASSARCFTGA